MFEFTHSLAEAWILQKASQGLGGLKGALLERHLSRCGRCRGFALDLVEFSHTLEPAKAAPRLSAPEQENLHARVMAAFGRERLQDAQPKPFRRAKGPAVRLAFVKALAVVALILGIALSLSTPATRGKWRVPEPSAANQGYALPASALNPAPTATAKATATATPTPAPAPKT